MLKSLTYSFWLLFIVVAYISIKYNQSRNKALFFKQGIYKAFIWSSLSLIGFGSFIYLILPENPVDISFFQMHSDWVQTNLDSNNNLLKYVFKSLFVFSESNLLGVISAAIVLVVWSYYIRQLDFFNKEKIKTTILVLCLGMCFSFLAFPLSDIVHYTLRIEYSENTLYNLFVYCFVGIGIIEEFIKLIPVLIIIYFTKEIDEPIDLIYYASMSALGFAFIENLIYFRDLSGTIVIGRGLTSAVGHMIDSSFVIYGFILYKFNNKSKVFIIYYFLFGAFVHALYDYFLFEELTLFFFASFIFFIQCWTIMINNSINNSKYFDYRIIYEHDQVRFRLAMSFIGLVLFNFLINGFIAGKSDALNASISSFYWSGFLIVFYVSSLSCFDLFRGYWRPIRLNFRRPNDKSLPGMRGLSTLTPLFTENTIISINHIGKKIKLHSPAYNRYLCEIFHISNGIIEDRFILKTDSGQLDPDWFAVKLDTPLNVNHEYESHIILIKLRSKYQSLIHDEHIQCWLKLIPKGSNLHLENISSDYTSYGFIMINGEDYEYDL
ncbi:PrsW family intramembrane metalloprotease [Reichenbachiella sp.]